MSLLDTASLIVTPNGYKEGKLYSVIPSDGSGDLSVTRATTATRVNSAGLVELVPYNLVQYSQEYSNSSFWSYYVSSVSANTATAPDGTTTADTLTISATNGSTYQSFAAQNAATFNLSTYFKKTNEDLVYMDCSSSGGYFGASFNLTTQAITTFGGGFSPLIESVGNGWYRCSVNGFVSGSGAFGVGVYSTAGQSAYIWGTQLNEGTIKPYQKTETRLNIPRLDYSNGTCPSLLVEPQRTNAVTYSEFFSAANGYNYQNASQSGSSIVSPSGQLAYGITSTTSANDFHRYYKTLGGRSGVNTTTIFAKKGTSRYLGLGVNQNGSTGNNNVVVFDLLNGVIASNTYGVIASIENFGNDWYRLVHTFDYGTGGTYADICVHNTGTSTYTINAFQTFDSPSSPTTIYVWGLQMEVGSYATSYIPTTSASVTRNADLVTKTSATALIGQTEGTIFGEFEVLPQKSDSMLCLIANLSAGTYANFFYIRATNGVPAVSVRKNDTTYVAIDGTTALSEGYHKFAFAYKQNDFAFYVDGVQIGTDNSGEVPLCNEIYLGQYVDGFDREVSKKSFALWKTRLTNTQLAQLTTI